MDWSVSGSMVLELLCYMARGEGVGFNIYNFDTS